MKILPTFCCLTLLITTFNTFSQTNKEELIPRSMSEQAKYYLLSISKEDSYLRTIHKRVSSMSTGYSVTKIDCRTNRYQDLGYGDNLEKNIKMYSNTKWTDLVQGSSKSDLVTYVCNRKKT